MCNQAEFAFVKEIKCLHRHSIVLPAREEKRGWFNRAVVVEKVCVDCGIRYRREF